MHSNAGNVKAQIDKRKLSMLRILLRRIVTGLGLLTLSLTIAFCYSVLALAETDPNEPAETSIDPTNT
ncbi:MAG: hypothetical protein ACI9BG_001418, partial [Parasphingorhabdus sp.]